MVPFQMKYIKQFNFSKMQHVIMNVLSFSVPVDEKSDS